MNCDRPLDPLDLEALSSGDPGVLAADASDHAAACPDCGRRLEAFRRLEGWLSDLPGVEVGPDLAQRVERLRGLSAREKRSVGIWLPPAMLLFALVAGSAALLSLPLLTGPEQAGLLSALPAALGLEWRSVLGLPGSIWRALPGSTSAVSDLLALERGYAALSILLLLPAGFSIARLWRRRSAVR